MRRRYQEWIYRWEHRLTTRDTNRVLRPFDWGLDWAGGWPGLTTPATATAALAGGPGLSSPATDLVGDPATHGAGPPADTDQVRQFFFALNEKLVANSDEFFSYRTPADFRLEQLPIAATANARALSGPGTSGGSANAARTPPANKPGAGAAFLRFTSPVASPYAENNVANARWFPARGRRAVVVLPQWNADSTSHNGLCRIFNLLGIAALRLSMPYHDVRMPAELERADYAVSANMGRTIDAARQAICDIRACLDWLETQGYSELGVLGTSLGSCYAFIASAHDARLKINAFNHASTYFGDVVWTGQLTRHVRQGVEPVLDQAGLRRALLAVSPMAYFDKFARWPKKSLVIYTSYDLTFLPEFSRQIVSEFTRRQLNAIIRCLPCGHYTLGELPYKYLDAWHLCRFMATAFST